MMYFLRSTLSSSTIILSFFSLFTANGFAQADMLRLNEVMSSNSSTIADEDGDSPDWIELYNNSNQVISLDGWGLSDNRNVPLKWVMPQMDLQPKQFLLIFASNKDRSSWTTHWETVVDWGDNWRYDLGSSSIPSSWIQPGYDDSQWQTGPSGFGFSDGDDATVISQTMSVFLRTEFQITDLQQIESAVFHIDYDDGFVAYLNGHEIARANLGTAGIQPSYDLATDTWREAEMYQGGDPEMYVLDSDLAWLQQGTNVLAVEVHNSGSTSSDLSAIPLLTLGMNVVPASPRGPSKYLAFSSTNLHTNFKISSDGESIYLSDNNSQLIDSVAVPSLQRDIAYGRYPDGADNWRLMSNPTPGSANDASGFAEKADMPQCSHQAGFYTNPFDLTVTASDPQAVIRYTTDGGIPDASSPAISRSVRINKTMAVRLRAFVDGKLPSDVVTHTFLIDESIQLPIVSITTAPENLWDEQTGIYVLGPDDYEHGNSYSGANFWEEWERPIHIEFFENDGTLGFETGAGIKIFGGWSRARAQKSVAIFFRGEYGLSELDYPIFPWLPFTKYQAFILRNGANDWGRTWFSDATMTTLVEPLDLEMQAYRACVTFINGEYWGILNIREKMNEHYIASHHHVDPDEIDMLEFSGNPIHGDASHYQRMLDYINSNDMTNPNHYAQVQQWMETDNFIDYFVSEIYFDNRDWPGNNIKYWRPRTDDGRWRWMLYDTDFGFGVNAYGSGGNAHAYDYNTLAFALSPTQTPNHHGNPPWSTELARGLIKNKSFRNDFINRACDLFNSLFEAERVVNHIDSLAAIIEPEMQRHITRWNQSSWWFPGTLGWSSINTWYGYVDVMREYAQNRVPYMKAHIRQQFDLPGISNVKLDVEPVGAGSIAINKITPGDFPWRGSYFQGVPVPLVAHPKPGFKFRGWKGDVSGSAIFIAPELSSSPSITAVFEKDNSPIPNVVFNEINYNAAQDADCGDWIELYNAETTTVDLSGWALMDEDVQHQFTIPSGTSLAANSFLVLARDTTAFRNIFTNAGPLVGNFDFGLNNKGELLRLYDSSIRFVDSVRYDDTPPWPQDADGVGSSLELINPDLDNEHVESWRASIGHGTPGAINSVFNNTAVIDYAKQLPMTTRIDGNYPNPFNPETTIHYTLAKSGLVTLAVFDVTGRHVETLINAHESVGAHSVTWNARDHASGIYFIRLQSDDGVFVKKMALVQ
ncbi:CotH kinase family protein [candidate division KSB1 bacterium]|nr:CotH kinase family protein [candidate division KSB1 bacterium]